MGAEGMTYALTFAAGIAACILWQRIKTTAAADKARADLENAQ